MDESEYLQNVHRIIDDLLKNAAHSFGLDFRIINETAIETTKRLRRMNIDPYAKKDTTKKANSIA